MENIRNEHIGGVPPPGTALIMSLDGFFSWAEAAFREGRDHLADFRKCLGVSNNDYANWKKAVWTGKNAWSRQQLVTARLLATLSYDGFHVSYVTKGVRKTVRGANWNSYTSAPKAPTKDQWEQITADKVRQLEEYYESVLAAQRAFITEKAIQDSSRFGEASDRQTAFVKALIEYVALLVQQGKMTTVLHIRESMSHLLHLLGENKTRFDLGEIALVAAVDAGLTLDRAQILVDDLGWAAHLLNQSDVAKENIQRGIGVANSVQPNNMPDFVESRLTAAKGYRHLALIAESEQKAERFLNQAEQVISSLTEQAKDLDHFHDAITRDKAQIEHARATLVARSLGILEAGTIPADHREKIERATRALDLVSAATSSFESIADYERLNKALVLEERLHTALGHRTAAIETRARRQKVSRSLSVRKQ